MAQTSTRKNSQARRRTTGRANGSSRSTNSRSGSRRSAGSRSRTRRSSSSAGQSSSPKPLAAKGKDAVAQGAQSGGKVISRVADTASKVKGPALAGGAALAGLAGGMAVQAKRDSRRKILGLRFRSGAGDAGKNLVDAGQKVGRFSENLGEVAAEMRRTREAIDTRGKHRSPIEVVLQALTARR
jgi:hypothetical protein